MHPKRPEIGLLLLVLKDLWTGFTPVGGGSNVGRGRLTGRSATLTYGDKTWQLEAEGDRVRVMTGGDAQPADLNTYVSGLKTYVQQGGNNGDE
ncbi:MAG: hypothetical protein R3C44_18595 [Chloroflexota bacterium]